MYNLYIKTHDKTGLKYLGQTKRDPFTYKGSGIYWSRHLKVHGKDHSTEIISRCETKAELEVCGLFFSKLFNVVKSKAWANLEEENGRGGTHTGPRNYPKNRKSKPHTPERIAKIRASRLGFKVSDETKAKISASWLKSRKA